MMAGMAPIGTLVQLIAVLLPFAWAVVLVYRWPGMGWVAIAGFIAIASDFPQLEPIAGIAGISVYPEDVLAGVLAIVLLLRLRQMGEAMKGQAWAWLVVAALLLFSLLR